jgi:hypothetical protein
MNFQHKDGRELSTEELEAIAAGNVLGTLENWLQKELSQGLMWFREHFPHFPKL